MEEQVYYKVTEKGKALLRESALDIINTLSQDIPNNLKIVCKKYGMTKQEIIKLIRLYEQGKI